MTVLALGDYETRDGHWDAKVVANNLSGAFAILAVLTNRETGWVSHTLYTMDGHCLSTGQEHPRDLVPLKPAPVMGPLDANDIIPGKTLIGNPHGDGWASVVLYLSRLSVIIHNGSNDRRYEFEQLKNEGLYYSNDCGATWHKCEKHIGWHGVGAPSREHILNKLKHRQDDCKFAE